MRADVGYHPEEDFNLYSVNKAMEDGYTVTGNKNNGFAVSNGNHTVKFDIRISTREGCVWVGYFKRTSYG